MIISNNKYPWLLGIAAPGDMRTFHHADTVGYYDEAGRAPLNIAGTIPWDRNPRSDTVDVEVLSVPASSEPEPAGQVNTDAGLNSPISCVSRYFKKTPREQRNPNKSLSFFNKLNA